MSLGGDVMSVWQVLGIDPTTDLVSIKRAYAKRLKDNRPDEDAAAFQRLREAYELAVADARQQDDVGGVSTAPAALTDMPVLDEEPDWEDASEPTAEIIEWSDAPVAQSWLRRVEGLMALPTDENGDAELRALDSELALLPLAVRESVEYELVRMALQSPHTGHRVVAHFATRFAWGQDFRALRWLDAYAAQRLQQRIERARECVAAYTQELVELRRQHHPLFLALVDLEAAGASLRSWLLILINPIAVARESLGEHLSGYVSARAVDGGQIHGRIFMSLALWLFVLGSALTPALEFPSVLEVSPFITRALVTAVMLHLAWMATGLVVGLIQTLRGVLLLSGRRSIRADIALIAFLLGHLSWQIWLASQDGGGWWSRYGMTPLLVLGLLACWPARSASQGIFVPLIAWCTYSLGGVPLAGAPSLELALLWVCLSLPMLRATGHRALGYLAWIPLLGAPWCAMRYVHRMGESAFRRGDGVDIRPVMIFVFPAVLVMVIAYGVGTLLPHWIPGYAYPVLLQCAVLALTVLDHIVRPFQLRMAQTQTGVEHK